MSNTTKLSNARNKLLWEHSNHVCLHCGASGSSGNKLEFHFPIGTENYPLSEYRRDDGQTLSFIENAIWEYEHTGKGLYRVVVLCRECHQKAHDHISNVRGRQLEFVEASELLRYRQCVNKAAICSYRRCVECSEFRKAVL